MPEKTCEPASPLRAEHLNPVSFSQRNGFAKKGETSMQELGIFQDFLLFVILLLHP
jgi:hypothetical protein